MTERFAETVRKRTSLAVVLICLLALSGCLSISSRDYDNDHDGYYRYHNGHYYYHDD